MMATVTKTLTEYTVSLTGREEKTLQRWSNEATVSRTKAAQMADLITARLASQASDYAAADEPQRRARYVAASEAVKAQVDALLGVVD